MGCWLAATMSWSHMLVALELRLLKSNEFESQPLVHLLIRNLEAVGAYKIAQKRLWST